MGRYGIFDIIGPIMIGPSSSHTAGAVRIGLMAGQLVEYYPKEVELQFHGSLAEVYHTHFTDAGVIAGLMGFQVDDERIPHALEIAYQKGIKLHCEKVDIAGAHPSTIIIVEKGHDGISHTVRSKTIGGGNIVIEEIDGFPVEMDGTHSEILYIGHQIERATNLLGSKWRLFLKKNGHAQFQSNCVSKDEEEEAIRLLSSIGHVLYFRPIIEGKGLGLQFFDRLDDLIGEAERLGLSIGQTVIEYEKRNSGNDEGYVRYRMKRCLEVMKEAAENGVQRVQKTVAGLVSGDAQKLDKARQKGKILSGSTLVRAAAMAMGACEVNAALGRVVACPTAGSCGTLGGAIIALSDERCIPDSKVIESLFAAAGVGLIIAENAMISGAMGGCQAECGVASAMTAAALVELSGGSPDQLGHAVAISLKNILGLVCDPVAGMVEVPCIKRNAGAVANAFIAADMALAGIRSVIPPDEVIAALKEVGELIDPRLRDTLGAGLSKTPTAQKIEENIYRLKP
jgi:L-serine dehydratase